MFIHLGSLLLKVYASICVHQRIIIFVIIVLTSQVRSMFQQTQYLHTLYKYLESYLLDLFLKTLIQ